MARALYRLGRLVAAHPVLVLLLWIAGAVGVTVLVHTVGAETSNDVSLPGTGSQAATDLLQAGFPPQQNGANPIIFHVTKGKVTDKAEKQAITDSEKAIKKIPYVHTATSPFSQQGQAQISKDKKTAFISVLLDVSSSSLTEEQAQRVMNAADPGKKAGMQVVGGGSIGTVLSPNDTSTSDIIGILAAMIILTLTFGTVVAMGMPIGTAVLGLSTALALIGLLGHLLAVPDIAETVATMIGLAVGIDYALFLVTRHRAQMREGVEVHESIARAVGTAGTAVVFAGCTVVVALASLAVAGIPLVASLGFTAAVAVATAVLAAVTLLPALMSLAGGWINRLALPKRFHEKDDPQHEGFWGHWARFATHRPWIPIVIAVAVLVPLIIPVFSLTLGQENIGQTPPASMERQAYDLMQQGFGAGWNGPLIVATAITPKATADPAVTAKENQAKKLQSELEQEQKQGNAMKKQLEEGQASLEQQQAQLERQQASLESQSNQLKAQQASLEAQSNQLKAQQAALESQAAQLQSEQASLKAEAAALKADATRNAKKLVVVNRVIARLKQLIAVVTDPVRLARLEKALAKAQTVKAQTQADIRKDKAEAKRLKAQEASLVAQAAQLQQQKTQLEAQAAQLQQQAAVLQQKGDALQVQADQLQQQGAALQAQANVLKQQKAQLEALQKKAAQQQKEAEQLQDELTKTLTKAGGDDRGTDPRLVELQDALINTKGDSLVSPPQINKKGDDVVFTVIATTAPSATQTAHLVHLLRDKVIPNNSAKGVTAFVGGSTASNIDLGAEIASRLPLVIGTILLLSMLVLLVAFRSLLIPLQAAVTNLVTAMAAFGVVTACFQWGWGINLVGIDTNLNTVPIASYVPLMMFAVLFGLSMDYQVFLLSSVDKYRMEGESERESVRLGLKASARVIAAAALIMISVFSSFVLNGDPVVKQFGVGLASAVFLAAAMVLVFAPALLTLMGRWGWWMPSLLGKVIPNVDIEGTTLGDAKTSEAEPEPVGD